MTQAEAAEIITSALAHAGHIDNILSADAFATRLATALDALGLLDHCALRIGQPVPGDPLGRARPQLPPETPAGSWAATRQRS